MSLRRHEGYADGEGTLGPAIRCRGSHNGVTIQGG